MCTVAGWDVFHRETKILCRVRCLVGRRRSLLPQVRQSDCQIHTVRKAHAPAPSSTRSSHTTGSERLCRCCSCWQHRRLPRASAYYHPSAHRQFACHIHRGADIHDNRLSCCHAHTFAQCDCHDYGFVFSHPQSQPDWHSWTFTLAESHVQADQVSHAQPRFLRYSARRSS